MFPASPSPAGHNYGCVQWKFARAPTQSELRAKPVHWESHSSTQEDFAMGAIYRGGAMSKSAAEWNRHTPVSLPAKAADTRLSRRFQNRNFDGFAMNSAFADFNLALRDSLQVLSIDGLDKSVA
jgi:hypothetical protein